MNTYDILKPSWYDRFSCKGTKCNYSCCKDWDINITKDELRKWKKSGVLSRVNEKDLIVTTPGGKKYAKIKLDENGVCPFLTKTHLCGIQSSFGINMLTNVCRIFPRMSHYYCGKVECSMSLGCERVLELLLEEKDGIELVVGKKHIPSSTPFNSFYDMAARKKYPALKSYYDIQSLFLMLLQAEGETLENRLILLGIALRHIDELYMQGRGNETSEYIQQFLLDAENISLQNTFQGTNSTNFLPVFYSVTIMLSDIVETNKEIDCITQLVMERLHWKWKESTDEQGRRNFSCDTARFLEYREKFTNWMKGKEYFFDNLMLSYMLYDNIPFKDPSLTLWSNYTYFVWVYSVVKIFLSVCLDEDSTDDDMIHYLAVFFRKFGHNRGLFYSVINDFQKYGNSLAHIAIVLKNC